MAVPAKFSKEFYDALGHRVADELVDGFRTVDKTYRTEFRELFNVRFNQLDARLEQRTAELRQEMTEMKLGLGQAIAQLETRLVRWGIALWITALGVITAVIRLTG